VAGISRFDFWKMTPREFYAFVRGYERRNQDQWQMTRIMAYYSAIAFGGSDKIKSPKDLFKLPGEESEIVLTKITKLSNKEAGDRYRAFVDKKGNRVYTDEWIKERFSDA
jgi:hypothetical protein